MHAFELHSKDGSIGSVKTQLDFKHDEESGDELIRMSNLDEVEGIVDALFSQFLEKRLGEAFVSQEIGSIRQCVSEALKSKLPTMPGAMA